MFQGSRVVGLLLVWMAVGFLFSAAVAGYQAELLEEADPGSEAPEPGVTRLVATAGLGGVLFGVGVVLLVRPPGEGRTPGVPLGQQAPREEPRRCWRCRKSWKRGADRCSHCGAERLRE